MKASVGAFISSRSVEIIKKNNNTAAVRYCVDFTAKCAEMFMLTISFSL